MDNILLAPDPHSDEAPFALLFPIYSTTNGKVKVIYVFKNHSKELYRVDHDMPFYPVVFLSGAALSDGTVRFPLLKTKLLKLRQMSSSPQ